ncbi:MAG: hypothetical protein J1E85_09085 [Ruminococcus sp.]|nr:hypothetical protein [Ruminococcus sp.]
MSAKQSNIPKQELETLARRFLSDIQAFFESEEGQKEYQEWLRQSEKKKHDKDNVV